MRQILWLLLLSSVLFCFAIWFAVVPSLKGSSPSVGANNDLPLKQKSNTQNALIKKQIYNQLSIALPQSRLDSIGVKLFADGTLRIQRDVPLSTQLPETFKKVLSKVLPNYFKILSQPHFSAHIKKIYIEAHTSSKWKNDRDTEDSFKQNKVLSNQQARAIEGFVYDLIELKYLHRWLELKLSPVGRSFQNLIRIDGKEDEVLSRRIELRIEFK